MIDGPFSRQMAALAAAAVAFERSGDVRQEAEARFQYGVLLAQAEQSPEAAEQFLRAARLYESCGDPMQAVHARFSGGFVLAVSNHLDEGLACFVAASRQLDAVAGQRRGGDEVVEVDGSLARLRVRVETARLDGLVQLGRADPSARDSHRDVEERCDRIIAITEGVPDAEFVDARLRACYQKARLLALHGDESGALPYAREAADMAAVGRGPADRAVEIQMRLTTARGHAKRRNVAEAVAQYRRAATLADADGNDQACEAALRGLARLLRKDTQRGAATFAELIELFRTRGSPRAEAICRFAHAEALEMTPRSPDTERDLQIGDEFHTAAAMFELLGDTASAANAYYLAGTVRSMVALVHAEHAGEAFDLLEKAAQGFSDVGNLHGLGVARSGQGELLNRWDRDVDRDDAHIDRLLVACVESFRGAERPAELASAVELRAAMIGLHAGPTDEWMDTALEAVYLYEAGRASRLLPVEREFNDQLGRHGFTMIARTAGRWAAERNESDPHWSQLVWGLEQVVKARSLQDQQGEREVWLRFLASDAALRRATDEIEHARFDLDEAVGSRDAEPASAARAALETARRAQRERLEEIAEESEKTLSLASSPTVEISELQAQLTPGEMYIGFVMCHGDQVLRSQVTSSGARFEAVQAPDVAHLLQKERHAGEITEADREMLHRAAGELIGFPDSAVDTLIICPDRDLVAVPWHVLPARPGGLLGDTFITSVVPAAGAFMQQRRGIDNESADNNRAQLSYLGVSDSCHDHLPSVDWEVQNICRTYFGESGRCLVTGQADRFLEQEGHVGLLHLACHAGVGGLVFSGGIVTPIDLANMQLTADILLLTACNAGAFAHDENNEFFGIVRQLIVSAEAKAAVVSLKVVSDSAAPLFADLIVSALRHEGTARPWSLPTAPLSIGAAVQWARRQMRHMTGAQARPLVPDEMVEPSPDDPDWWSPWFLVGDPRARMGVASQ